ncbi:MAG: 6-phosphofructokinase [Flavobacteriales bacterium]|nr:6-phosphofructokinase [Flavobacteriales bacterium]MEB2341098.1 6-phosphofructokinase [Flavobacteriia bacterium]
MSPEAAHGGHPAHIGVFTSGGDAPGMNAAIRAVVRTAHYHGLAVSGIYEGFEGMVQNNVKRLGIRDVSNIIQRGGTILRSARSKAFMTEEGRARAKAHLDQWGIDALIAIGGDGTFRGASLFAKEHGMPVIGISGTIDNDLRGTDRSIGFDTATNTAMEMIDRIRDTASSHDRLFFVEVMGRTSGAIALHCGIAAGAEFVMVPEYRQGIDELIQVLQRAARSKSSVIVIVAEGDEEGGAYEVARKVKGRFAHYDTRVSVLGHVQRGGNPTVADRLLASRSGVTAVEGLLEGRSGAMVGEVNGRMAFTPFEEVVAGPPTMDDELLRILGILSI